jgi:hypothetical protein
MGRHHQPWSDLNFDDYRNFFCSEWRVPFPFIIQLAFFTRSPHRSPQRRCSVVVHSRAQTIAMPLVSSTNAAACGLVLPPDPRFTPDMSVRSIPGVFLLPDPRAAPPLTPPPPPPELLFRQCAHPRAAPPCAWPAPEKAFSQAHLCGSFSLSWPRPCIDH